MQNEAEKDISFKDFITLMAVIIRVTFERG